MKKENVRIAFMGTPAIAATVLKGLLEEKYAVVLVIAQQDKPVGRKARIEPVPTKKVAQDYGIEVFQPEKVRLDYRRIQELKPDLLITCAYGQLISQEILDLFPLGCLNVHGSLLPKYRGASPIQAALFAGEKETGVTIMEMILAMDAGKMFFKQIIPIVEDELYTTLYEKMAIAGKEALLAMLPAYLEGTLQGESQEESQVSFCKKITPEEEHIPLAQNPKAFVNYAHALSFVPGGYVLYKAQKLKIFQARVHSNQTSFPLGTLFAEAKKLCLQVQGGVVELITVQKQNKSMISGRDFLNGEKDLWQYRVE